MQVHLFVVAAVLPFMLLLFVVPLGQRACGRRPPPQGAAFGAGELISAMVVRVVIVRSV